MIAKKKNREINENKAKEEIELFRVYAKVGYNDNGKLETTSNVYGERGENRIFLSSQVLDTTHGVFRFATVNHKAHSICLESPYLEEESGVEIEIEYGLSEDYYTELYR